jgi:hypothetical protein
MKKPKSTRDHEPGKDPRDIEPLLEHASVLIKQGGMNKARQVLHRVLRSAPGNRVAHLLLNHAAVLEGDLDGLRRAVELQRSLPIPPEVVASNLSHLSLRLGDMPRGWDQYEARWRVPGLVKPERTFSQPRWKGEPFLGKTLLLHYEQGLGDTLMFVRYAKQAKALGGEVLLAAQVPLADLVATCPGVDAVIPHGTPFPPFDLQLPLLSLPQVFQTDLNSIPAEIPYLDIPESVPNREWILGTLAKSEGQTRIGLVWAGSPAHKDDLQRSVPPATLKALAAIPGVAWYSFQIDSVEQPPLPGLVILDPMLRNLSDTAFALSGMDLVITVDTAVAHLAGALGIPILLLLSFYPDWRWMLGRDDSPWYPSMRLYRQSTPGDWDGVLHRIVSDLTDGS